MLSVTRYPGERIVIGNIGGGIITVQVVSVDSRRGRAKVMIGIDAPQEVTIDREEVYASKVASGELMDERSPALRVPPPVVTPPVEKKEAGWKMNGNW